MRGSDCDDGAHVVPARPAARRQSGTDRCVPVRRHGRAALRPRPPAVGSGRTVRDARTCCRACPALSADIGGLVAAIRRPGGRRRRAGRRDGRRPGSTWPRTSARTAPRRDGRSRRRCGPRGHRARPHRVAVRRRTRPGDASRAVGPTRCSRPSAGVARARLAGTRRRHRRTPTGGTAPSVGRARRRGCPPGLELPDGRRGRRPAALADVPRRAAVDVRRRPRPPRPRRAPRGCPCI